ncbi:hypothetical protein [Microlunatus sp. Gsoil 973]|jgi:cell division septum initiation protein DivIVA|uniref:hypothetical protein n=1 Tax=Microlunatus sp. Gsoil 973 TaxID=2672569 RepID=UPI0012B4CD26|nr:hypothetical protein [Microlunatus sp. Gsoil 973]QGN32335.1 hypothetical protein GJV80_05500 [Microlunatus sp. Gsoil 973]
MSTSDESTGLNLFDEKASAVGNFPTALRGYDRSAVDDYVRSLEGRVVQAARQSVEMQSAISDLQDQLSATRKELENRPAGEPDYSSLGARAGHILKMAEEQAQEMLDQANVDANKLRSEGQRDADRLRQQAEADGAQIRKTARSELDQLRQRASQDAQAEVERARTEAQAVGAAAEREVEALRRQAQHEADSTRQAGYLEAEQFKKDAEAEAAAIRKQVAEERVAANEELKRMHQESVTATGKLLTEATQHHQEAGERLAADIAAAAAARTEAKAEAERIRLDAREESERLVAAAKKQAERITQRTHQELQWRKEQLKRETDNLVQRKQAVLNQLQSLSALASQSATDVPDLQPLADLSGDLEEFADQPDVLPTESSEPESSEPEPGEPGLFTDDPTLSDAEPPETAAGLSSDAAIDETAVRPAIKLAPATGDASANDSAAGIDEEDDQEPTITVETDQDRAAGNS